MAIVYARVAPKRDTKQNWSKHPEFVPFRGEIIIYTDYKQKQLDDGRIENIPGLKVGDGRTAVNELPFVDFGSGGVIYATINGVPVEGDLTLDDLGIQPAGECPDEEMSDDDISNIIGTDDGTRSLAERIMSGSYVDVMEDEEIDGTIQIDHDIELDLDGNTLTATFNDGPLFLVTSGTLRLTGEGTIIDSYQIANAVNGGKIVIESGTFTASHNGFVAVGEGSKITMNGGAINSVEGGLGALDGAEIEMNGGNITTVDNFCIFTNGTEGRGGNRITLNGGILVGNIETEGFESVGVYIANNDTFIMNGGSIVSTNGCGILMRAGFVTLNGGSVETGGTGPGGKVGDCPVIMDHSAVIYHESADYPGKEGMSLTITGGTYFGVEHSVYILSNEQTPNVKITGGTFYPDIPKPDENDWGIYSDTKWEIIKEYEWGKVHGKVVNAVVYSDGIHSVSVLSNEITPDVDITGGTNPANPEE